MPTDGRNRKPKEMSEQKITDYEAAYKKLLKMADFEKRYDEIIAQAKEGYEYVPPGKYYRDGNLYQKVSDIFNGSGQ